MAHGNVKFQDKVATPKRNTKVAVDQIDGEEFQRFKLTLGAEGVDDEDVSSANPIPISAAALPLPAGAATSGSQALLLTELKLKADLTETQPVADSALLTELQIKADPTEQQYSRVYAATGDATYQVPRIDKTTHTIQTIDYAHHEVHAGSKYFIEGYADLGNDGTLFVKLVTPAGGKWGHFTWELGSSGILTATLDEDATGGMAGGSRPTIHANNRNVGCWTGSHTGADDQATVMTDSTAAFTVDALIGYQIFNSTDGSSGIITDNDATTITVAALAGGTGNDWDTNDTYEINNSQMVITSAVTVATSYIQRVSNTKFGSKGAGGTISRADEIIMKANTTYLRSFTSGTSGNVVNFKAKWYEHTDKAA